MFRMPSRGNVKLASFGQFNAHTRFDIAVVASQGQRNRVPLFFSVRGKVITFLKFIGELKKEKKNK